MHETNEIRRKRLRFRSQHRGSKELDLLLGAFADRHLAHLTAEQLARYEAVLASPDPEIYAWITGGRAPPGEHDHDVMKLLKSIKLEVK